MPRFLQQTSNFHIPKQSGALFLNHVVRRMNKKCHFQGDAKQGEKGTKGIKIQYGMELK